MKDIIITEHALDRFNERTSKNLKADDLKKLFKAHPIIVLEPAWRGRETADVGGYVWVLNRTTGKIVATTCLGSSSTYSLKRPHKRGDTTETAYRKWLSSQKNKSNRKAKY